MAFLDQRLIVLLFLFIGLSYSEGTWKKEPVVNTNTGRVRGLVQKTLAGEKYLSFRGIPYAKPPVGPLRFEDPVPAKKWLGVRDAKFYGHICPQIFLTLGNEDCLFVNVFTKGTIVPTNKRPVMVWIHGGALLIGDGGNTLFGPDYLIRKDIVLVTFNYRLGVLGFLDLEDEIAPGNQGLKDQVLLLKWVKQNIANFGGDPDNVTIFGESSGGMSVHWLALSPLTKGLFHKVIIESGNIFNRAVKVENPKNNTYKLVDILGRNIRDHRQIKDYLKTLDPQKLIEAEGKVITLEDGVPVQVPFGIGKDSKSKNPLLPVDFDKTALNGIQVPLLVGYNSHEVMGTFNSAAHTDELEYIFRQKLHEALGVPPLRKGKESYRLMEQMTEMWSNFAIYGRPTPTVSRLIPNEWLPLDNNRSNLTYFNLGENLRMERVTSIMDRYSEFKKSSL